MTRYRLAIFDFDGTLADSLPWFRASVPGHDRAVRSRARPRRRGGRAARHVARAKSWRGSTYPCGNCRPSSATCASASLPRQSEISLFAGIPAMLERPATPRHQDRHRQFRQRSVRPAGARTRHPPDHAASTAAAAMFGKHWKFRRVARRLGVEAIGDDLHRRRDPRHRGRQSRRHGSGRGGLGLCTSRARCRRRGRRICSIRSRR